MMNIKMFLVRYAEIGTKGKNRYVFEDILCKRIRNRLKPIGEFRVFRDYGRIYIEAESDYDYDEAVDRLTKIFGVVGICPVTVAEEMTYESIKEAAIRHFRDTFEDTGYDFSFNTYVYDSDSSNQKTNKHAISLLPEFAFIKKNLSISIASGLCASFNFQSTKEVTYSSYSSGTSKNEQLTKEIVLQVFWISTLGVKYRLTNHIALIGDFSVSVAFLTTQLLHERSFSPSTYGTISYPTYIASGRYPLFISPKIGVCYTF